MKIIIVLLFSGAVLLAQGYGGYGKYGGYGNHAKWDKTMDDDAHTVGHWVFDSVYRSEKDGGNNLRIDLSGNDNDFTANGFPPNYTGQLTGTSPVYEGGNALEFDGVDDYFSIASAQAGDFSPGTSDFTIEMWLKFSTPATEIRVQAMRPGGNWYDIAIKTSGEVRFEVLTDAVYYLGLNGLDDNSWHYVVFGKEGSQIFKSADGTTKIYSSVMGSSDVSANNNYEIGAAAYYSQYYTGYIAEVRHSDIARTDAEIATYYSQF